MNDHGGVAIITGAGSGIGRAVAQAFLGEGWSVVLAGRREKALREAVDTAPVLEPRALPVPADVRDPASVDDLYEEAATFIIETQRGSASLLQRRFSIGYTRASRLIDLMGEDGILGEHKGSVAREVLISQEDWEKRLAGKSK